jgi:hypothetical protein
MFLLSGMLGLTLSGRANAQQIAVFGDNEIDNLINTIPGFTATLVTDGQLATPGFLNSFSAFVYTRNGSSFTAALSAAAAANVSAYVGTVGNIVLLNGDFADPLPGDSNVAQLVRNSVTFAAASGRGYVGELGGAGAALSSASGLTPLGLIAGTAGAQNGGAGGSGGSVTATPAGAGSTVFSGVTLPTNPGGVEFGQEITGVNSSLVYATWSDSPNSPAVIVRPGTGVSNVAPEPASVALMGLALVGGIAARRRRS